MVLKILRILCTYNSTFSPRGAAAVFDWIKEFSRDFRLTENSSIPRN
jgi:hypothetical protein